MFLLKHLDTTDSVRYESLTFQYTRSRLLRLHERTPVFAIGAEWMGGMKKAEAVGLIIIDYHKGKQSAEVISLFVKKDFREQGIGTALLREAETLLQGMGCLSFTFVYYSGKAITPSIEALLSRSGWSQPLSDGNVYKADRRIAGASWIRKTGMPGGMRSFYWQELSDEENDRLRLLEGSLYPGFLSPFKTRFPMEESNSLGLRIRGETVGWCITYRIAEDTLLYDSVFVTPPFRLSGCAFMLVAQSISIQLERQLPYAMFAVNNQAPFMRKIVDRWLIPYTTRISEKKVSHKILNLTRG